MSERQPLEPDSRPRTKDRQPDELAAGLEGLMQDLRRHVEGVHRQVMGGRPGEAGRGSR